MKIHVLTIMLIVILFSRDAFASSAEERLLGKAAIAFVLLLVWWLGSLAWRRVKSKLKAHAVASAMDENNTSPERSSGQTILVDCLPLVFIVFSFVLLIKFTEFYFLFAWGISFAVGFGVWQLQKGWEEFKEPELTEKELEELEEELEETTRENIKYISSRLRTNDLTVLNEGFHLFEMSIAQLFNKEQELLKIVTGLENVDGNSLRQEQALDQQIKLFEYEYGALDRNNKKELLPLMFSGDMQSSESPYIGERVLVAHLLDRYESLLAADGLRLDSQKKAYLEENPYSDRLPIGDLDSFECHYYYA